MPDRDMRGARAGELEQQRQRDPDVLTVRQDCPVGASMTECQPGLRDGLAKESCQHPGGPRSVYPCVVEQSGVQAVLEPEVILAWTRLIRSRGHGGAHDEQHTVSVGDCAHVSATRTGSGATSGKYASGSSGGSSFRI